MKKQMPEFNIMNKCANRDNEFNRRNIFHERFFENVIRIYKWNEQTYEGFKKAVKGELQSQYWSRFEYEVLVSDDFFADSPRRWKKVDMFKIYLEPNLDLITKLTIDYLDLKFE